jgi:hypothetical protein
MRPIDKLETYMRSRNMKWSRVTLSLDGTQYYILRWGGRAMALETIQKYFPNVIGINYVPGHVRVAFNRHCETSNEYGYAALLYPKLPAE